MWLVLTSGPLGLQNKYRISFFTEKYIYSGAHHVATGRSLAAPALKIVTFLKDFNQKSILFRSPAAPDPPRASKLLLFLRISIKDR